MGKLDQLTSVKIDFLPRRSSHLHFHMAQYITSGHPVPASGVGWAPTIDVYETSDEYVVEANLGGVEPELVHVEFQGTTLRIYGDRPERGKPGMRCYHVLEIERGNFERLIEFEEAVDPNSAKAVFHHGLLLLHIAKRRSGYVQGCSSANSMEGLE
jgi:HSP20 family molecular chaperone IbpA